MDWINVLGYFAAACTTIAFVPQVVKTLKTKSAKDLSLGMFLIFCAGVAAWLVYGIINEDYPILIANAATLLLSVTLLYCKLSFKN